MKIETQNNLFRVKSHPDQNNKNIPDSKKFDELFKMSINSDEKKNQTALISPISATQRLSGPSIVSLYRPQTVSKEQLVEKMDYFLRVLEDYAQKLEDPNVDMHDIHPLISSIKRESEYLGIQFNQLSEHDNLKNILGDMLQTTSIELNNFENGDYVTICKNTDSHS